MRPRLGLQLTTYDHIGIQPGDRIVISWDIALSEMESGDYLAFPGGHDDQVDALAQGLAWGRQSWSRRIRTYAVKGLY